MVRQTLAINNAFRTAAMYTLLNKSTDPYR